MCRLGVALAFIHHGSESWWHVAEIDSWISWEADCCCTCLVYWSLIYLFKYIKQEYGRNIWKGSCYRTCIDQGGVAKGWCGGHITLLELLWSFTCGKYNGISRLSTMRGYSIPSWLLHEGPIVPKFLTYSQATMSSKNYILGEKVIIKQTCLVKQGKFLVQK